MSDNNKQLEPQGELSIKAACFPADTNPAGDIFGGYLMSQMDIAGAIHATRIADGRVVTVAVDAMEFLLPVFVGDLLHCYTKVLRTGSSSVKVAIEAWVCRRFETELIKVTEGTFTYVAIGQDRRPKKIKD